MSSDYKLAIAIGGKVDASLAAAAKEAQGILDGLNGKQSGNILQKGFGAAKDTIADVAKASVGSWTAIAGGMATAAAAATATGMTFESAMADLAGTAGITRSSEAFAQYQEAAREVGATTNKTATEAAQALKYMSLAGWDVESSIAALDDMVKLSSASNTDLARTSDLVTDSMGALNLGMDDYASYMDLVAKADSAANYSSAEFMETMIGAGGAARVLSVDLNELSTAAGILANNGTKGSEAGTKLNSIFARIAGNSEPVADALAALGTTVTDDSGNFLTLENMLLNIKSGLAGVSDEAERASIMKDLFGTHNLTEAQYLLDAVGDGGAWDSLSQNLQNAQDGVDEFGNAWDVLDERYKTATDTLQGELDRLKSTIQDFGIEIYQSLVGDEGSGIRGAVKEATTIMNELKEAFKTDGLDGLATGIGDEVGKVAGEIGDKGSQAIESAGSFAEYLVRSIGANADSIGSAASQIITSLGSSFMNYTDDFVIAGGELVKGLMDGLTAEGTAEQWATGLGDMVSNIGTWFSDNGATIGEAAGTLVTQLATQLAAHSGDIISGGIGIVKGLAQGILTAVPVLIAQLPTIMGDIASGIVSSVPEFLSAGLELGTALINGLISGTANMELESMGMAEGLQFVADNTEVMRDAMSELFHAGDYNDLNWTIQSYVDNLISGKQSAEELTSTMQALQAGGGLPADINNIQTALSVYKEVMAAAQEQVQAVQEATAAMTESAAVGAEEVAASAGEGIQSTADNIMGQLTEMETAAQETSQSMQEALTIDPSVMDADALSMIIKSIDAGNIGQVVEQISSAMTQITTSANNASTAVSTDFSLMATAINLSCVSATMITQNTAIAIQAAFGGISLYGVAVNAMQGLINGLQEKGAEAIALAQSIAAEVGAAMAAGLAERSPSKITTQVGAYAGEGLILGLKGSEEGVYSAADALANTVQRGSSDSLSGVLARFNSYMPEASAQAGTPSGGGIVFSPQITITGNASESDVRKALDYSMDQFRRMFRQMQAEDRRAAYV